MVPCGMPWSGPVMALMPLAIGAGAGLVCAPAAAVPASSAAAVANGMSFFSMAMERRRRGGGCEPGGFPVRVAAARGILGTMEIAVGTCGFSYKDWVGPVYPPGTKPAEMLPLYARRFP